MMIARRWMTNWCVALTVLAGVLCCSVGLARANFIDFSASGSFGSFGEPGPIAVDESTGDVFVFDEQESKIEKFDAAGDPVNFSALGTNAIPASAQWGVDEAQVAVDNSSGPAKGDIYVATSSSKVAIYGSDGQPLGFIESDPDHPWGRACGVAVDRAGNVYVGLVSNNVNRYTPTANPVTRADYTGSLTEFDYICNVGADVEGNVYVDNPRGSIGSVVKFDPSQFGKALSHGTQLVNGDARTLAVANSFSGELFIDFEGEVLQYDSSGNRLSAFGGSVSGLGFNARNGKLYLANASSKTVEVWQGQVDLPNLQTGDATGLSSSGAAILNGAVEPEESSVQACSFQYGTSTAYGTTVPCEQSTPLSGNVPVPVSADLSGVPLNKVFHYRLSAENSNGTASGEDETFAILVPPTVEDQAPVASASTRASAKLTGTIDPEQADTSYHFEVGTSESYGHNTPTMQIGEGVSQDVTVAQQVGELLPDTTYHYRLVASNVAGLVVGADHTFTTGSPTPPTVVTGGAGAVAQNSATISGLVSTNGLPTSYGFEIGTSTDYGPPTGLGAVGAGASEAPVSLPLTGLLPGTTYHYRLTATNVDGAVYGADRTFTTSVFASTFAEPPAPLPFVTVPQIAFPAEAKAPAKTKTAKKRAKKVKSKKKVKLKAKKHKRGTK